MKKKLFIPIVVIGINLLFMAVFSVRSYSEEPVYKHLIWFQCNCETGEPAPGQCTKALCDPVGLLEWCLEDIPCGNPPENELE